MAMEIRHLRVLVAVAEAGTFSAAARRLGLAQGTVSETVLDLERRLGTRVFRRGGQRVALTAAGEALLARARPILAAVEEAEAAVSSVRAREIKRVRLAVNESVAAYLLAPRLPAFHAAVPGAELEVHTGICTQVRSGVAAGEAELGLIVEVPGSPEFPGLTAATLVQYPLTVVVGPGHPWAGCMLPARAWAEAEVALTEPAGPYAALLRRYLRAFGLPLPRVHALGGVEAVKQVAAAGRIAGVLPAYTVAAEVASGRLAAARPDPPLPAVELRALWRAGEEPPGTVRVWLGLLGAP